MKKIIMGITLTSMMALTGLASALDTSSMIGKWKWEGFTISVTKGGKYNISAKVLSGPKNVGLEMIQSALKPKGNALVGKIKHPATGDTYNAKLTAIDKNTWSMNGCTASNVCAEGKFVRVK